MKLTLPYPPTLNHLYSTVRGRRVLSADGRHYKTLAASIAYRAGVKMMDGPLGVAVKVYRPRRAGDLDNTLKCLFDSLTGIVWGDDGQVVRIEAWRYDDPKNPRVDVHVWNEVVS